MWVRCKGSLLGLVQYAMLGFAYIQPRSKAFPSVQVINPFIALTDELLYASLVDPHSQLCDELNAKVGGLNEVTHAHRALLVAHPALHLARWCER